MCSSQARWLFCFLPDLLVLFRCCHHVSPLSRERVQITGGPLNSPLNSSDSNMAVIPPRGKSLSQFSNLTISTAPPTPQSDWNTSGVSNEAREKEQREPEAGGICLTGTRLYRPLPFQFKRPLSWKPAARHYSQWRGKKHKTALPFFFFMAPFRTSPADLSRTL